jgi:hypothetical protein
MICPALPALVAAGKLAGVSAGPVTALAIRDGKIAAVAGPGDSG